MLESAIARRVRSGFTDTGTGFATVYGSKGVKQKIVVTIPSIGEKHGTPTGEVYNGPSDFKISQGSNSGHVLRGRRYRQRLESVGKR